MSNKCNAKYKNLNLIQSYSEQRYAVLPLFEQICMNDEYLKQQVEKLNYLSPPAVRKRFVYPDAIDDEKSYGFTTIEPKGDGVKEIIMSNSIHEDVDFDFADNSSIDLVKSNCEFESYMDNSGNIVSRAVCRKNPTVLEDYSNAFKLDACNSFWYVGYDKSRPYIIVGGWAKNPKRYTIPSVVRAQTFKCTLDDINGQEGYEDVNEAYLESITLFLQNTGEITHSWASPLYVQIWPTELKSVDVTEYQNGKPVKVYETVNGKRVVKKENIYYPKVIDENSPYDNDKSMIYRPLAEAQFNPTKTIPDWYTIVFDKKCKLKKGEHYAIVMFSPLSHPSHCPRVGGFGRNCRKTKYEDGDAFLSENNGRSFVRYGTTDTTLTTEEYRFGKETPQDFMFEIKCTYSEEPYEVNTSSYLYFKPIFSNPIKNFSIGGSVEGETNREQNNQGISLKLQYSVVGGNDDDNWCDINLGERKYFNSDHPQMLYIRAVMNTSNPLDTPCVEYLNVDINTDVAKQMYVRTIMHQALLDPILGASHWGRVYAPFKVTPNSKRITATAEIIENSTITEHIDLITVSDLDSYLILADGDGNIILDDSVADMSDDERAQYLIDNPSVLRKLKEDVANKKVYVKPYTLNNVKYYMSFEGLDVNANNIFDGSIRLCKSPAYPILSSIFKAFGNTEPIGLGEWYDYTVDYDADILTISEDVLDYLPSGSMQINYNPVFIQGLSDLEVGNRVDEETGLQEEGLILDYFKESFLISDNNVETRSVDLKAIPVDPVREVIFNKDMDNEQELYEDIDFQVDYENKKLIFFIKEDSTQASILSVNDTLDVIYTPNLHADGISIGWWVKRESSDYQCNIKNSYIEHKV